MALTLTRRRRIAPMQQEFARRPLPQAAPLAPPDDHYHIEGETIEERPSVASQVVRFLQVLLILVVAILSAGIVWMLGAIFRIW